MDLPSIPQATGGTGISVPGLTGADASNLDPNSVPGLLNIANQQGGAVAEQANQLANPNTSILSTIGDGFKNAFGDFVKAISLPSEAVAGLITSAKGGGSITDAIKNGTDPYQAIFGSSFDPNESVLSKVGGFVTRTAVDTLFDPLTFVGDAPWDMLAKDAIPLFGDAAAKMGVEEGAKVGVNAAGQDLVQQVRGLQNTYSKNLLTMGHEQAVGDAMANFAKTGNPIFNPAGEDLKAMLAQTLDLSPESLAGKQFVKTAVSDLLTQHPALIDTVMDKGGLKVLGKTVIEGARIRSAIKMIPGMTTLDGWTKPARNMVTALFDPAMVKVDGQYIRLPQEFMDLKNQTVAEISGSKTAIKQSMYDFAKGHGLNMDEVQLVRSAMEHWKLPSDPKLAKAYLDGMGLAPGEYEALQKAGLPVSKMEGYVMPHVWKQDDVKLPPMKPFKTPVTANTGALEHAELAKYIEQGSNNVEDKLPSTMTKLLGIQGGQDLVAKMKGVGSTDEAAMKLGEHLNNTMNSLTTGENATTFEKAMQHPDVKTMMDARNDLDALPKSPSLVGRAEDLGLNEKLRADEVKSINDRLDEALKKSDLSQSDLEGQITKIAGTMQDLAKAKTEAQVKAIATSLGIKNASALKSIADQVASKFEGLDIPKMVSKRLSSTYKEGMKIPQEVNDLSEGTVAAVKKIAKDLPQEKQDALNDALKNYAPKAAKKASTGSKDSEGMAGDFVKEFFAQHGTTGAKLSGDAIAQFVKTMKGQMETNPKGFNAALDSIIGRKQQIGDVLENTRLETQAAQQDLKALPNQERFFTDTSGKTYQRVAANLDELDAAGFKGFDHNFMTAHMSRMAENARAITMRSFVGDVAKSFGTAASEAPAGYRPISGKAVGDAVEKVFGQTLTKDGEQIVFHPAIAKTLEDFTGSVINDAPTKDMLKAFDKLQGAWKASVTSIFPQFHGRNLLTHVANNMLDLSYHALDPATNGMAAQFVRDDMQVSKLTQAAYGVGQKALDAHGQLQDLLAKTMFTDNTGHDWSYGEIRQMVKDYGVSFGHDAGSTEDLMLSDEDFEKSLNNVKGFNKDKINPLSQNFQPFAQGRQMGSILANQQRMVNFISNLRATGNVELAASRTKQFLFDYGALTNFEKTFMRRIIPFYTFTRKNIELQVKSLLTTPGRISGEIHSIQNLGDVMSGNAKLSAAEQAALPDWIKSGAQVVSNKNGENVTMMQGFPLPIEQPFLALQPNAMLGSVSPLLRVPIEQATGYSFFQGKPLSDITNAAGYVQAPDIIKKAIGFTTVQGHTSAGQPFTEYVSLNPSMMNLFNNLPPTSRVLTSLKQINESGANAVTKPQEIMQQLIGTKFYSFDLTQQAQIQQNKLKQQLQDILTKAGVTATYSQSYIPKGQGGLPPITPQSKGGFPFGTAAQIADMII